jgi:hypothetical protein
VISESRSIDRFTRSLRAGRRAREIPWADYLRQQRGGKGLTCSSRRERPWLVGRDRKAATREGQLRVQACLRHVARVSVRDTATRDPRPALQQMVCFRSAWHGASVVGRLGWVKRQARAGAAPLCNVCRVPSDR